MHIAALTLHIVSLTVSCTTHTHIHTQHVVEMEDEDKHHEGCRVSGTMVVKRVQGKIHISVHQNMIFMMMPQVRTQ